MPAQVHPDHRREDAHRHDQDHRQRQGQRLILRGQHQEDEDHREQEDERGGAARRLLLIGQAGPFVGEARRQGLAGELAPSPAGRRRTRPPAPPGPGARPPGTGCSAPPATGRCRCAGWRPRTSGTIAPVAERTCSRPMSAQIVARRRLRLGGHPEGPAEQVEVVDVGRAEIGAERLVDLRRLDAEQLRPVAVDVGLDPGASRC